MGDILPTIIYPSTVTDYNARLKAAVDGTNLSVQNCQTLDSATQTSWGLFYSAVTSFVQEDPGIWGLGARMDRAESYSQELLSWQNQIAKSCKLAVPTFDPTPPGSGDLVKVVQYLAWGAGALAIAYTVGQVISVVPKSK